MRKFEATEFLTLTQQHAVTHTQVVPTHLVRLCRLDADTREASSLDSLRYVVTAGAPCSAELKDEVGQWLGPRLHEYYGGSEAVGICAIGPDEITDHRGSVGRSLLGAVHITDNNGDELPPLASGQVWFEAPTRFEYHNDPDKTAQAWHPKGWGTMGDIGYLDHDGYLYLTGRIGDTIVSGGANVYPADVDAVLINSPLVYDAGVVGIPDPDLGETVAAFVQLMPGVAQDPTTTTALREHVRSQLAGYKCPKVWHFIEQMPRTPAGKLLRRELTAQLSALHSPRPRR